MEDLYKYEKELRSKNINIIGGVDEVGRGPLIGSVVASCVVLPKDFVLEGLTDSKKLSEKKRDEFYKIIKEQALAIGIGIVDNKVIDEINILNATKAGVTQVVDGLDIKPDLIIIDALNHIDTRGIPYEPIIKGDAKCYNIAAASILAKVTRDRIMRQWDEIYPCYGFSAHKGYGTARHIEAIKEYGLCPIHRRTFTKNFI